MAPDTKEPEDISLTCPKCGSHTIATTWHRDSGDCTWTQRETTRGPDVVRLKAEHLHRSCRTCAYHWPDPTLDAASA